jgi:quercetin dioxygenase-like cupin family protein
MADRADLVREVTAVDPETWDDAVRGCLSFHTLFSREETSTQDLTAGIAELASGGRLAEHRHHPSEVYYVLEGRGVLALDGEDQVVSAGTSVFIPGDVPHGIRNDGPGRLRFFYVLAAHGMADVDYQFDTPTER